MREVLRTRTAHSGWGEQQVRFILRPVLPRVGDARTEGAFAAVRTAVRCQGIGSTSASCRTNATQLDVSVAPCMGSNYEAAHPGGGETGGRIISGLPRAALRRGMAYAIRKASGALRVGRLVTVTSRWLPFQHEPPDQTGLFRRRRRRVCPGRWPILGSTPRRPFGQGHRARAIADAFILAGG